MYCEMHNALSVCRQFLKAWAFLYAFTPLFV